MSKVQAPSYLYSDFQDSLDQEIVTLQKQTNIVLEISIKLG